MSAVGSSVVVGTAESLPRGPHAPSPVQLWRWTRQPDVFLDACREAYGDTFTVRLPRLAPMVVTCDPALVRGVFSEPTRFLAGHANAMLRATLGERSLLLLDGAPHHAERRRSMPPFHGERIAAMAEAIRAVARDEVSRWAVGEPLLVHPAMKRITGRVIRRVVLGDDVDDGLDAAISDLLTLGNHPSYVALQDGEGNPRLPDLQRRFRGSPLSRLERARARVDALVAARVARAGGGADVLSMLAAPTPEGSPSPAGIRDAVVSLIVAGHRTTATTLGWVLYRLASEDAWDAACADESGEWIDRFVKETLRLHPSLPVVLRRVRAPTALGRWLLPAGTLVAPSMYLAHRRAEAWPDPLRFDPERFRERPAPTDYFPFGGGDRACLGAAFATAEIRQVVGVVARSVRLGLAPGYTPRVVRRGITFGIADDLPVTVERR